MSKMMIATRSFTASYGGENVTVDEGERVADNHELVRRHPDAFRSRELREELEIRSARIAELQRDADTAATRDRPMTESTRRQIQEDAFWRSVEPLIYDPQSQRERAEQSVYDEGLATAERLEELQRNAEMDELTGMWHGRIG